MFKLSQFIRACEAALRRPDPCQAVREIVAQAMQNPSALEAALVQTPPAADEQTGQYIFLHRAPDLAILNVIMPPRLLSPPHNHLTWAVIGIYKGQENNIFYRRAGGCLAESRRQDVAGPRVIVLDEEAIHSIANPLPERSCGLQIYGDALDNPRRSLWNPFTWEEEAFQLQNYLQYEREMTTHGGRLNTRFPLTK